MISLEARVDDIHEDWRSLWAESLPEALRARVFADPRLREDLGRRIAAAFGADALPDDLQPFEYRDFLAFRADAERAARLAGLLLFVEALARAVHRDDVERLTETFGLDDPVFALGLRDDLPSDNLDLALPDAETVEREGRAALRAWIETLPKPLADRATLMMPREAEEADYPFAPATRVAAAGIVLDAMIERAAA